SQIVEELDGGGSVRALTDLEGNITDTFSYDAYGNLLHPSSLFLPTSYLYRGERYDPDLGQYYLRARFYDANLGRFHTLDEYEGRTGEPLSLHKYLYAHANPVTGWDPSGGMFLAEAMVGVSLFRSLVNMGGTGWAGNPLGRVRFAYVDGSDSNLNDKSVNGGFYSRRWYHLPKYYRGLEHNVDKYKNRLMKAGYDVSLVSFQHIKNWDEFDVFLSSAWPQSISLDIIYAHGSYQGVSVFNARYVPDRPGERNGRFTRNGIIPGTFSDVESFVVAKSAELWSCYYGGTNFDKSIKHYDARIKKILSKI
ncbi:MAG: RHS repeat-associated core domain-containing protein, partial [Opitutales bacterium]|nr:RHS repeat-associated core domain-containing protein [Opitutales bacterium]